MSTIMLDECRPALIMCLLPTAQICICCVQRFPVAGCGRPSTVASPRCRAAHRAASRPFGFDRFSNPIPADKPQMAAANLGSRGASRSKKSASTSRSSFWESALHCDGPLPNFFIFLTSLDVSLRRHELVKFKDTLPSVMRTTSWLRPSGEILMATNCHSASN